MTSDGLKVRSGGRTEKPLLFGESVLSRRQANRLI